jgi:PAS domain S-box-containing protein
MVRQIDGRVDLSKSVLVVEDDKGLVNLIVKALVKSGYNAIGVSTGAEAIQILESRQDLVLLLDQQLPDMTGRDIISLLSNRGIKVPFIMMTGQGDERLAVEVMKLGAADYLLKDIDFIDLLPSVLERVFKNLETERKLLAAEEALRESEARFKALHNASFGGIAIHNKGIILECNQGLSDLTGFSFDELIGMNGLLLIAEPSRELVLSNILNGYEKPYTAIGLRKNGEEYPVRLEARNIPYKGISVRTVEFRDITEQVNAEKELIKSKEKAEESDRLKTAFLQNMSHEIRTPMNSICGFSEMLKNPNLTHEKRNGYTDIIINSSNQLLSIVTDILTIASLDTKLEKLKLEKVNLNSVITELLDIFNQLASNKSVNIFSKNAESTSAFEIFADRAKITQILTNLLSNALKFTPKGEIEVGYRIKGEELELFVRDTGIGIHKSKQEIIFNRFVQADKTIQQTFGGTGLGLSICKGFLNLMGGNIWVESELGFGSTFFFTIPFSPVLDVEKLVEPINSENITIHSSTNTVLVAEDYEFNLIYIEEILRELNCTTICARNGREAVDICLSNNSIDLVLMDIRMPVMDGHTAAKIIKEAKPNLPIIAQTAYGLEKEIEKYKNIFDNYITKPINSTKLKEAISQYIIC